MYEINLDKKREVRFTNRSLIQLEKKLGVALFVLLQEPAEFQKLDTLTHLIWAGLQHEKNPPGIDKIIDTMDFSKIGDYITPTVEALTEALGEGEKK